MAPYNSKKSKSPLRYGAKGLAPLNGDRVTQQGIINLPGLFIGLGLIVLAIRLIAH